MDRRFFVLAAAGELGPFTPEDLKRELQAGTILRSDQLRTAHGKTVGTVGEMVGPVGPPRPSTRMAAVGQVAQQQRQAAGERPSSSEHPRTAPPASSPRSQRTKQESVSRLPIIIIGALVVLLGIIWALSGGKAAPVAPPVVAEVVLPQVRVDAVQPIALPGRPGLVRITIDRAPEADLALRGTVAGMAGQRLVLAAGTMSLDIPVPIPTRKLQAGEKAPTEVSVSLQPGDGYRLGTAIYAKVAVRTSPEPTVAWDDFAGHGAGWQDVWQGGPAPEPVPGFGVRLKGDISFRFLATRVATGDLWLSLRMKGDENLANTAGFSIYDQGRELLFVGRSNNRGGLIAEYSPQTSLFLDIPDHQFTTAKRIVLRLRLGADDCKLSWWVEPSAAAAQPEPLGSMTIPPVGIDAVRTLSSQWWLIGDLRIGRSWDEVVPLP